MRLKIQTLDNLKDFKGSSASSAVLIAVSILPNLSLSAASWHPVPAAIFKSNTNKLSNWIKKSIRMLFPLSFFWISEFVQKYWKCKLEASLTKSQKFKGRHTQKYSRHHIQRNVMNIILYLYIIYIYISVCVSCDVFYAEVLHHTCRGNAQLKTPEFSKTPEATNTSVARICLFALPETQRSQSD